LKRRPSADLPAEAAPKVMKAKGAKKAKGAPKAKKTAPCRRPRARSMKVMKAKGAPKAKGKVKADREDYDLLLAQTAMDEMDGEAKVYS
jgi:hypothetical protein